MLVSVFGTPSALTYWGIHTIRAVMQAVYGDYHFIQSTYLDELRQAWSERAGKNVMFVSDCPETRICELFIKYDAPIFVFSEDPVDVIDDIVASGAQDESVALRLASRSFCALEDLFKAPAVVSIRNDQYDDSVRVVVEQILRSLRVSPDNAERKKIIQQLVRVDGKGAEVSVRDQIFQFYPSAFERKSVTNVTKSELRKTLNTIARTYGAIADRQQLQSVEWPMKIFLDGDRSGAFVEGFHELLGPARFLIYGPYMHLPRGRWTATAEIELSDNLSGNILMVDVVAGGDGVLAQITADLPTRGRFSFQMEFEIIEPVLPIEIRFQILSGAIEGRFLLHKVVINRRSEATSGDVDRDMLGPPRLSLDGS